MNEHGNRDSLLDAFLDDLGTAPVPADLPKHVSRRILDERPGRQRAFPGWLGLAAAVVVVAMATSMSLLVAGPKPTPSASSDSPSPAVPGALVVNLNRSGLGDPVPVTVVDPADLVASASAVPIANSASIVPAIIQGRDAETVVVRFAWSSCSTGGRMTIAADRSSIELEPTGPEAPCAGAAGAAAIELAFRERVDPTAIAFVYGQPTVSPTPAPSIGQMPPPEWQPTVAPTIPPTLPPDAFAEAPAWRVSLTVPNPARPSVALVVDPGGIVAGAGPAAARLLPAGTTPGVLPGSTDHALDVYWPGTTCDGWATVDVKPDGSGVTVTRTPVSDVCAPTGYEYGLELQFGEPVNAAAFTVSMNATARYTGDPAIFAADFADASHGLAAMANGTAMAADTSDGGTTWHLTAIAEGLPTGVARADADWMAISCDPSSWDHCAPGVYRRASGSSTWVRAVAIDPGPVAASGSQVAVVEQPLEDHATGTLPPATGFLWSTDSGATWTRIPNPCPSATPLLSSVDFGQGGLLIVCEGSDLGGSADKAVLFADSPGRGGGLTTLTPAELIGLPRDGTRAGLTTPSSSTGANGFGPGFYWAKGAPLFSTTDGGSTWTARRDVADGDIRAVRAAQAWSGGGGLVLVYDRDLGAAQLLVSSDGLNWDEIARFLDQPCCGG